MTVIGTTTTITRLTAATAHSCFVKTKDATENIFAASIVVNVTAGSSINKVL